MQQQEEIVPEETVSRLSLGINAAALLGWAILTLLLALLAYWLGARQAGRPGASSPEAGFARDMMTHHGQAVDMATLVRDRSEDPELRQVALDIILTQQSQIGQMRGWLNLWGYPIASTGPAMEWMDMPTTGRMPGMASPEQLNELRAAEGPQAEELFLRLMITHHQSGVAMAQAALDRVTSPDVRALAESMVAAQTSEIALMQEMLAQRGAAPAPAVTPGAMPMEHP